MNATTRTLPINTPRPDFTLKPLYGYDIFRGHGVFSTEKAEEHNASLAQLAEQLTLNQWVSGSSPEGCTWERTASDCESDPRLFLFAPQAIPR